MTNAVLVYDNKYETGTVTASTEATRFPAENAFDKLLNDYWQPESDTSHTLDVDMGSAVSVDVFGFYSSDFFSFAGAVCKLYQSDDDVTYTLVGTITASTIGPKLKLVTSSSHRYWRLQFDTTAPQQPKIQHAILGEKMEVESGLGIGFMPMALGSENTPINSVPVSSVFIGRSLKKKPTDSVLSFKNLSASWLRSNWPAILSALELGPFMVLPQPDSYPDEAAFCWTDGNIKTPNYISSLYLGFSIPIKARIT